MTNLVTGASGFFGSALVRGLLARGEQVRGLVRQGSDIAHLRVPGVEIHRGDITQEASLTAAMQGVDRVYHAAAQYSLSDSEEHIFAVNVTGTRNVARAALQAGVRRLVFVGTASNVGSAGEGQLATEESLWDLGPMNIPYLTSKFLAEVEALRWGARGLDVVVVEPAHMIGERAQPTTPTNRWLVEFLNGNLLAVPPIFLNLVDVDDVVRGCIAAAEKGRRGERYLLTHWNTTAEELFSKTGQLVGRRPPLQVPYEVAFAGETVGAAFLELLGIAPAMRGSLTAFARKRMQFNNEKAIGELGFTTIPIEQSLEKAIRWFNGSGLVKRRL